MTPLMKRLAPDSLSLLPPEVKQPVYDRTQLQTGIVHLGVGAFMRAHLAVATEAAIEANGDLAWGICGVSLRQPDTQQALGPQQGLYTVAVRDADAQGQPQQRLQAVGCLHRLLVAPHNPAAVVEQIAAPATRIVSLTITEKGYCRDSASGQLQMTHPDLVADLAQPSAPRSALGLLLGGLRQRQQRGLAGLALMSLDNLPHNGHTLRRLLLDLAAQGEPGLSDWITACCSFPCSMVDRIVPRTTDADRAAVAQALGCTDAWPVLAEPFFDWAVEDHFVQGRPDWTAVCSSPGVQGGARFVADAAPWEQMKLRMVNGAHSAIAYLGLQAGWQTVDEAMQQPALRHGINALLRDEVAPTLTGLASADLDAYRARLLQRFANPALAHRLQQIAMDGSQKIAPRWLGTLRDRLHAGQASPHLATALAAWLQHLRGSDEAGRAHAIDDPLAAQLATWQQQAASQADVTAEVSHWLRFTPVFGDTADLMSMAAAIGQALACMRKRGATSAWAQCPDQAGC